MKYLSLESIGRWADSVFPSYDSLPDYLKDDRQRDELIGMRVDYTGLLRKGSGWLVEPMVEHQTRVCETLTSAGRRLIMTERRGRGDLAPGTPKSSLKCFLGVGDRFFPVTPYQPDMSVEARGERSIYAERYFALPEAIAEAYYSRVDGIEVAHELPFAPMDSRVLPAKIGSWMAVEYFFPRRGKQREAMRSTLERIAAVTPEGPAALADRFRVILDSREQGEFGPLGDFLIVDEQSRSGNIYHVRDGDFTRVRLLTTPVETIDQYCAWVFGGGEGSFDFTPHGEPF